MNDETGENIKQRLVSGKAGLLTGKEFYELYADMGVKIIATIGDVWLISLAGVGLIIVSPSITVEYQFYFEKMRTLREAMEKALMRHITLTVEANPEASSQRLSLDTAVTAFADATSGLIEALAAEVPRAKRLIINQ